MSGKPLESKSNVLINKFYKNLKNKIKIIGVGGVDSGKSAFEKITDVPILFNTSFNLGGDPLVETIEDAMDTLKTSDIEYMYLPEIGKLVKVPNE